ncbi:TIR domain-containing protein [Desulfatibacillum aliphaticivorans]|uniref:TIR domain-containing protein n=1 Tax=Desulfatibacillum aliphaticivorans TaxID=218208 RepID=UPI0003FF8E63|nr:TIR domain-containing protein [Desulfatibacillum aliphaticivorans]
MDNSIRENVHCIIGNPSCGNVFASLQSCFVAYGYKTSPIEVRLLKRLLEERGIECIEAGSSLSPGQHVFCHKICSKIITSQFCIVMLNHDESQGLHVPNANVNMEYGLMLGFNKYVIPFQKDDERLPFNVTGLDTAKYNVSNFEEVASQAIDKAITDTHRGTPDVSQGVVMSAFLMHKKALITPLDSIGDRNIFELGRPLGFIVLNDFSGMDYMFFGNFTRLSPASVVWHIERLDEIIEAREQSIEKRIAEGILKPQGGDFFNRWFNNLKIWVVVNSEKDKCDVADTLKGTSVSRSVELFSYEEVERERSKMPF